MLRTLSFSGCLWYALDNSVPKRGKKMVTVHMTAVLPGDVQQVWTVVTGVEDYSWRSDLSWTEVLSAEQFVEHTQTGAQTLFTITAAEPGRRWELGGSVLGKGSGDSYPVYRDAAREKPSAAALCQTISAQAAGAVRGGFAKRIASPCPRGQLDRSKKNLYFKRYLVGGDTMKRGLVNTPCKA